MPSFTSPLSQDGPIADILVSPTDALIQQIKKAGLQPPTPFQVRALIDTGASTTVINPQVVQTLGLLPVGTTLVSTPTTQVPVPCNLVAIDVFFMMSKITVGGIIATETPMGGQSIQMLIGRDILRHGVLVYTGYINQFTLSF